MVSVKIDLGSIAQNIKCFDTKREWWKKKAQKPKKSIVRH